MAPVPSKAISKPDYNVTFWGEDHKKSPYLEEAVKRCVAVCEKYNLKNYSKEFSEFCAYTIPLLPEEPFYLANEFMMFHWQMDDKFDSGDYNTEKKFMYLSSLCSVFKDNIIDPNIPQTSLLMQLIKRVKCDCLRKCLKDEFIMYSDSVKKVMTVLPEVLELEEYMKLRKHDSGCSYSWLMMFLDKDDFEPYKTYIETEQGQQVWNLALKNTIYINDVISMDKEIKNGSNFNIVLSWMKKHGKSKEEAIADVLEMARECMRELLTIRDDKVGNEVLEKLVLWCRGHNMWAVNSPRYNV